MVAAGQVDAGCKGFLHLQCEDCKFFLTVPLTLRYW